MATHDRSLPRMPPHRVCVACGVIAFVAMGSLYDIVTQREHWPFSTYHMYSERRSLPRSSMHKTFFVTSDGEEIDATRGLRPFDPVTLSEFFAVTRDERARAAAVQWLLRRARRMKELRNVVGVRLYACTWDHDSRARNRDQPRRILEYELLSAEAPSP